MGTTTTPKQGLIKPDSVEAGSNFPAQHASNMDKLDDVLLDSTPGVIKRVATLVRTSDSGNFTTTEVEILSVTAPLVAGKIYKVVFHGSWASDVAGDALFVRIHEDTSAGTILQESAFTIDTTTGVGWKEHLEVEFTAAVTGNKTFKLTANRAGGSGNCRLEASTIHPSYLYVDYVRG